MNGTLTSEKDTNVIYIATNNDKLTNFEVKNTENTVDKILVDGNKVVITDPNNKVLFESNENSDISFEGDSYKEPEPQEPTPQDPTPQNPEPQNPAPQNPAPQDPAPQNPEPQNPASQNPEPQDSPATEQTQQNTETQKAKDVTPKTGSDVLAISMFVLSISAIATIILNKKESK